MPSSKQKPGHTFSAGLVKMGRVPDTAIRVLAANIQTAFEIRVDVLAPMEIPRSAFQAHRGQYDAGLILKHLAQIPFPGHRAVLAVTDVDLCSPIFTYVFGEAELGRKLAVVSDFRLKAGEAGSAAPAGTYYERLVKVALHEIGHNLLLYHCDAPKCLMQISPKVTDLDLLDTVFCEKCEFILLRNMRGHQV